MPNICQLDGNTSILSNNSESESKIPDSHIQIVLNISALPKPKKCDWPPWFEPHHRRLNDIRPVRQTISRNSQLKVCNSLPTVSVSNMRSLIPKISNFKDDMLEREISLALLSEVWEKKNSKKQQFEVEKLLQLHGLKYISTPRMNKRGGGAAIVANLEKFSLEKLDIWTDNLEIVWGLLRPKSVSDTLIREIIVVSF